MAEYEELEENKDQNEDTITKIGGMYEDWFLDYASYVILERAVPGINDGFKCGQADRLVVVIDRRDQGFLSWFGVECHQPLGGH